ncbi:MAG: hypothetical protein COV75_07795 [Candidatus Omnitrophica bacterium CG11_big_fil_rev_8_21_14_0_20_63_9]|nr:MAG: hypothetical protein COV75_07795 [Candidatus Omnitrophica bacterium CG11_big_fil_rev_8_21_14_0_20_63_9]
MAHLIFLERRAHVSWAQRCLPGDASTRLVALTAEALQALQEYGLPHEAVSAYVDARELAPVEREANLVVQELTRELEPFIAQQYPAASCEGPGFLSGQSYYLQRSACVVATRAVLMRETIRACAPESVTVFEGPIDPWFLGDGYRRNPWIGPLEEIAREARVRLQSLPSPAEDRTGQWQRSISGVWRSSRRVCRSVGRTLMAGVHAVASARAARPEAGTDLRLLIAGSLGYDWAPVLAELWSQGKVQAFAMDGSFHDAREWTYHYAPILRQVDNNARQELDVGPWRVEETEREHLSHLVDAWIQRRQPGSIPNVLGVNLFPALATHLKAIASLSVGLARHADAVASRALDVTRPHAVCFFSMPWLAAKRLAQACREREIPVVCYQHGGLFGTHEWIPHEHMESGHADYFLTYGPGIQPPAAPVVQPTRARYVPVGSARIESMVAAPAASPVPDGPIVRVLWIAERSTRNTTKGAIIKEDTARYLLQTRCLELLASAAHVRVTYRPHGGQVAWDGTTRWLAQRRFASIRVEASGARPLEELIRTSDMVLSDAHSATAWNEVLALGKPLLLYYNPEQTPLTPKFSADLERACVWCRSPEAFFATVQQLALEGQAFVAQARRPEASVFLQRYVLNGSDGRCAQRAASFLSHVCRDKRSVEDWQRLLPPLVDAAEATVTYAGAQ